MKLNYEAGKLFGTTLLANTNVDQLLFNNPLFASSTTPYTLYSALLHNTLLQISQTNSQLTPTILSQHIISRRSQLCEANGPVDDFQRSAFRSVLQFYVLTGAASITVYLPWSYSYITSPSALGMTSLIWVFNGWILQKQWLKVVAKFFRDWTRIEKGLNFDIKVRLIILCTLGW